MSSKLVKLHIFCIEKQLINLQSYYQRDLLYKEYYIIQHAPKVLGYVSLDTL